MGPSWLGAGLGMLSAGVNWAGQRNRENRALNNQRKLMGDQLRNQQILNRQGADLQMDLWNKTNYGAQMKHLKNAGLNAGLMYGKGGAGGTTGSQGGGSATGGNAPSPQPMELGTALQNGMQLALMKAQKENIEADTENKKTGATGQGLDNKIKGAGMEDKLTAEEKRAYLERKKREGDTMVNLGSNKDAGTWHNGVKINRYEQAELEKLEGSKMENLLKDADIGLKKATAGNLLSNDELVQLQTDLMSAQMGMINSDAFKKLPVELRAVLLMVMKKLGGI